MGATAQIFGVVPHLARPEAVERSRKLIADLEARGATVRVPKSDAERVGLTQWSYPEEDFARGMSLAFSMGGDGTMLHTVELAATSGTAVLGVNIGHLGYLTTLAPDQLSGVLDRVVSGSYLVEQRMLLDIAVTRADGVLDHFVALNDAVIEKSSAGNTVRLGVELNGEPFIDYSADGLIVATPTGSTAYAFSARGPIVSPLMDAMVVVPVSAHMLFDRSLLLDGRETVKATVLTGRPASLFVDGRAAGQISSGGSVVCARSKYRARLVTFSERNFHAILKAKFGLVGSLGDQYTDLVGEKNESLKENETLKEVGPDVG
jgi:NAD+ kinase